MSELSTEAQEKFDRIRADLPLFAKNFLIINKKSGSDDRFEFNRAQKYVHERLEAQLRETGMVRALILKGRQQGISTYVQARFFRHIVNLSGKKAFILTHQTDATAAIFEMTKRYSENIEPSLYPQPTKKNNNKLMYDAPLGSGYRVGTAGNKNIGRSMTNQYLHLSEYAFYRNAESISLGLMQTVAYIDGTEIIKESTANGVDNDFYKEWVEAEAGLSSYQCIFVPWYWQEEYCIYDENFIADADEQTWLDKYEKDGLTKGHLNWRRIKLKEFKGDYKKKCKKFRQEYPLNAQEAFINSITNTFIDADIVKRARNTIVQSESSLIIGIDPARSHADEGDRTAIIRRRGRKAYGLETYYYNKSTKLIDQICKIIDEENPARVCIDAIGMGGPIVDRLHELGYTCVEPVIVSNSAYDEVRFANLRAELWSKMRDWLCQDMPVEIPDSDELQTDLTVLMELEDRRRRLLVEGKKDLKARGFLSPDTSDALMLTFFGGEYIADGHFKPRKLSERTRNSLI